MRCLKKIYHYNRFDDLRSVSIDIVYDGASDRPECLWVYFPRRDALTIKMNPNPWKSTTQIAYGLPSIPVFPQP